MKNPSFKDVEQLTAYLDDQLKPGERSRLKQRLADEPQLAAVLQSLRESRSLLRQLPQRRAPRNFTLTPKMAGIKPPLPRTYPVFRFASVVAGLLFIFTFALNAIAPLASRSLAMAPSAPFYGIGGGAAEGEADMQAAEEAPAAAPAERPLSGGGCDGEECATPELEAAMEPEAAPTESMRVAPTPEVGALPPAVTDESSNKVIPEESSEQASPMTERPISPFMMVIFLGATIIFGGAAFYVRWRTDKDFLTRITQKRRQG